MQRWIPMLLCVAFQSMPALEIHGEAGYLDQKLRPVWRFASLESAIDDIANAAGIPAQRSAAVLASQTESPVCLVARERITVKQALAMLETANDLHIVAESNALRFAFTQEAKDQRRRLVSLRLSDWALSFAPKDAVPLAWGLAHYDQNQSICLFSAASNVAIEPLAIDPQEINDFIARSGIAAPGEIHGGTLYVMATPEEEQSIRKVLTDQFAVHTRQVQVRVRFGITPPDSLVPTGILPVSTINSVAATLQQVSTLDAAAMLDQQTAAACPREITGIGDVDVVNDRLDPVIRAIRLGRGMTFRALSSDDFVDLTYQTAWVDAVEPMRHALAHLPPGSDGPMTTATASESDDKKTQEVTTSQSSGKPASTITISLPSIWTWQPRGRMALPRGFGAIFCAPHPAGKAVIIWEILP